MRAALRKNRLTQQRGARLRIRRGSASAAGGIHFIKSHGSRGLSAKAVIGLIRNGLPVQELEALQKGLDVPMETLTPKLGISKATFHRRKLHGRLRPEESDRVFRYARLLNKAVTVLESE